MSAVAADLGGIGEQDEQQLQHQQKKQQEECPPQQDSRPQQGAGQTGQLVASERPHRLIQCHYFPKACQMIVWDPV